MSATSLLTAEPFLAGVDANYSLEMEARGTRWHWPNDETDLFTGIHKNGAQAFRVRLWTREEGVNGRAYATRIVERSLATGLAPYLVIFLSEDWADLMKQPAPSAWSTLPLDERAEAVRKYSHDIVRHFRSRGLKSHLYEVGNEIDYGICGVYPGNGQKTDPESLRKQIWPDAAKIILASQAGVREADPEARFMLHVAHWWDAEFCIAFFQFMLEAGVQVDFAGLSYFPSSNIGNSLEFPQFTAVVDRLAGAIDRPVIVAETGYPGATGFDGQFAGWQHESPGYPLTPEGQAKWLEDFLSLSRKHPQIRGVFYWSPEWSGETMWKAFALFDDQGRARPAWRAFGKKLNNFPSSP